MMPSIGFGTAGLGEDTGQAVKEALLAGYALFDTAQVSTLVAIKLWQLLQSSCDSYIKLSKQMICLSWEGQPVHF